MKLKSGKNNKPVIATPVNGNGNEKEKGKGQSHIIAAAQQFSGPIPPPEVFQKYGDVIPDAPERILKVFEKDSQHTRDMQKAALDAETKRDLRAQWMAFTIMLAAIGLTAFAVVYGNSAAGIITGLATMFLGLRVLFVNKNNEPTNKNNT